MENTKIYLSEKEMPDSYLNISYYLNKYLGILPDPPLHPGTKEVIGPEDLAPLFPNELIKQEVSMDEKIEIPEEVRRLYSLYRPSPLVRAKRLEKALGTPAKIFYKNEGVSPAGSHKLNTALAQAYYNKKEGVKKLITETGAGQWGTALAMSCKFFNLECLVFMVKISFEQKPYRRIIVELFDGKIYPSPSKKTKIGEKFITKNPDTNGSLGMAIAEAIEETVKDEATKYSLGSVLNHVLLHQTIVGQEAMKQMQIAGVKPDIIIGCCGGGSNFAGLAFPFLADELKQKSNKIKFIGVEPKNCATMCRGDYRYDFGDSGGLTPLLKMETLGHDFVPPADHAGGLRYHGIAPLIAFLHQKKLIEARCYSQIEIFKAAKLFAHNEGMIVAPESAHAVKAAIDEAILCRRKGEKKNILFNLSGHGLLDLKGYEDFLSGKIK